MPVEFTCTRADYLEAVNANSQIVRSSGLGLSGRQQLATLAWLACIVTGLCVYSSVAGLDSSVTVNPLFPGEAVVDIHFLLYSGILAPAAFLGFQLMLLTPLGDIRLAPPTWEKSIRRYQPPKVTRTRWPFCVAGFILTFWLPVFWLYLSLFPDPAGAARPIEYLQPDQIILGQFVSWIAVGYVAYLIRLRKNKRLLDRLWTLQPEAGYPKSLTWDQDALTISDRAGHWQGRWDQLRRFVETENLFLIFKSAAYFEMVPRRAFSTSEDAVRFLAALTDRIGNGHVLNKPSAFPVLPLQAKTEGTA